VAASGDRAGDPSSTFPRVPTSGPRFPNELRPGPSCLGAWLGMLMHLSDRRLLFRDFMVERRGGSLRASTPIEALAVQALFNQTPNRLSGRDGFGSG